MKLKLFPKIALILIALATLPVLVVGWQTAMLNRTHLENNILELQTNLANSLSKRIDLYLTSIASKTRGFIESLRVQGITSVQPFQVFLDANEEFIGVSFLNAKGEELLRVNSAAFPEKKGGRNYSGDPVFKSFAAQEKSANVVEPKFGFFFENGDPRLVLIFPYNPRGFSQGAIRILVSLSELWKEIVNEGAGVGGGGREAFVVDRDGFVIAHSNPRTMAEIASSGGRKINAGENPLVREAFQKRSVGSKEYGDPGGEPMIGSYSHVKWTDWTAVIQQPKNTAYFPIYQTRRRALQIVLLSIFTAAAAAFVLARTITRPILRLIEGAKEVARGNFNRTVDIRTRDEMADLAKTFNEMTQELRRYADLQVDRMMEEKIKTESVIFSIADGILLTDENGRIQLANAPALRLFSFDKKNAPPVEEKEFVGRNLMDLVADEKIRQSLRTLIENPGVSRPEEIAISEGTYLTHHQLTSKLVFIPKTEKKLGVVTVIHDVTLEREMDEMKEAFLHSITHDLRNPMTSIIGFIRFLKTESAGPVNESQKKMLEPLDRASARLLGMVNDILDVAKIEAGKFSMQLEPVPVYTLLEDTVNLYRPLAEKRAIRMEIEFPPNAKEEPLLLPCDSNQIERVIGNLLANAIKFSFNDGVISVAVQNDSDKVEFSIRDRGPGIPEEYLEKIFDKFQQVKGHYRGGTGLGLTICKYFIELHQGKIWVESRVGEGSRFVFWVPKGLKINDEGDVISTQKI